MTLRILNPTRYARQQWVLFGSEMEQMAGISVRSNPGGSIFAVPVLAPVGSTLVSNEAIEAAIEMVSDLDFLSPAVKATIGGGLFRPEFVVDGVSYPLTLKKSTWTANLPGSIEPAITKFEWRCQGPGFYGRLWTILGRGDSVMPFEAMISFENLTTTEAKTRKVAFRCGGKMPPVFVKVYSVNSPEGVAFEAKVTDRQSISFDGAFLFYSATKLVLSKHGERNDLLSAWSGPLVGGPDSEMLQGPWHRDPWPLTEGSHLLNSSQKLNAFMRRRDDLLAYVGWIGSKRPGDTGEQGGFGAWQGFDSYAYVGSRGRMPEKTLYLDGQIARQEVNRPIMFFEEDGEIALARNHPDWISFTEGLHYDTNVCPDRMRRKDQTGGFYNPNWLPNDDEHDVSALWPSVDVLANDGEASRLALEMKAQHWIARHTLPSKKPRWPTAGAGTGRHIGRGFLNVADNYRATGNLELLNHAKARFHETIEPHFAGPLPAIPVYRVICGDNRVFKGKKCGWICWEDGIFCMGLDAFRQVLVDAGWHTTALAVERIVNLVAKSLLLHAFWWEGPELKFAQRISWELEGKEFPSTWYGDEDFCVDDTGTDYKNWMRAVLSIGERWSNDETETGKAAHLRAKLFRAYLGDPVDYRLQKYDGVL